MHTPKTSAAHLVHKQLQTLCHRARLCAYRQPLLALAAIFVLGGMERAQAVETYYWGGGTSDIEDNTSVPLDTNGLSGTWTATTSNWASSPFGPNTYSAWQDGSIANFGYFTNAANVTLKLASDYALGGVVVNALSGRSYDFNTNTSSPVNLTIGGAVNVLSGSAKFLSGVLLAGSSDLQKWGAGELQLRANSSNFTGNVAIREGQILLDSSNGVDRDGGIGQVSNISIATALVGKSASTPILYYAGRDGANDALNDSAVITLTRGQLTLQPGSGSTETIGRIDLEGGGILRLLDGTSGTLTLGDASQGLTRGANGMGTMLVQLAADGSMKTTVKVAKAGDVPVDTLLPWIATSQGQFMKLDFDNGNALTTVVADTANADLTTWAGTYVAGTDNLRVTGALTDALTGNTTVNSLGWSNSVASTLDIGSGNTLTVASGGVAVQAGGTVTISSGTLTTTSDALYLNMGTGSASVISAVISGTDVALVKCGSAQLTLSGSESNTYTGTTYVNCGSLVINKSGSAVGVAGNLVVRDGASIDVKGSNPFGATSSITADNSYLKFSPDYNWGLGGKLTLNNSLVEMGRSFGTNMIQLKGSGTGFEFNGGVVQFTTTSANTNGTLVILTDVGYGAASTTQASFENVATNGSVFRLALNTGSNAATATRTFEIADSTTLAAGQAEMVVDAAIVDGGSGTTTGALRKTGSGALQLVGTNGYTGGTTVKAGTLQISTLSSAAQSGLSATFNRGSIIFLDSIARSLVPGQVLSVNGTNSVILSVDDDYRVTVSDTGSANNGFHNGTIAVSNFTRTGSIQGDVAIDGGTLRIDNAENTVGGNLTFGGGAVEVGEGNTTDYASKIVNSTGAIHVRTTTNSQNVTLGALDASNIGGLQKSGDGTLTLSGNNSYTGALAVDAGVLNLNSSTGGAAASASSVSVASGASLLVSQSNQVNNSASVTLSGGTIQRASGASEVFGDLVVNDDSFLDFGSGTAGTISFGTYTPSSLLTVQNFFEGNVLTFGSDLTSTINDGNLFSFSGGFTSSWDNVGTFTITAIPEPSAILAALALVGMLGFGALRQFAPRLLVRVGIRP